MLTLNNYLEESSHFKFIKYKIIKILDWKRTSGNVSTKQKYDTKIRKRSV